MFHSYAFHIMYGICHGTHAWVNYMINTASKYRIEGKWVWGNICKEIKRDIIWEKTTNSILWTMDKAYTVDWTYRNLGVCVHIMVGKFMIKMTWNAKLLKEVKKFWLPNWILELEVSSLSIIYSIDGYMGSIMDDYWSRTTI